MCGLRKPPQCYRTALVAQTRVSLSLYNKICCQSLQRDSKTIYKYNVNQHINMKYTSTCIHPHMYTEHRVYTQHTYIRKLPECAVQECCGIEDKIPTITCLFPSQGSVSAIRWKKLDGVPRVMVSALHIMTLLLTSERLGVGRAIILEALLMRLSLFLLETVNMVK